MISLSFRLVASSSGALYPVMLAFTGQRVGINSFLGMSNSWDWKNWIVILLIPTIYLVGMVIIEIPIYLKLSGLVEKFTFTVGTFLNFLFVFPDYGVMLASCYLWVKDLKTKLKYVLSKQNSSLEKFEEVLKDYLKLRNSLELMGFIIFPFAQVLAISSAYLGFTAGIMFSK